MDKWEKDIRNILGDYRATPPEGLLGDVKREMARRRAVGAEVRRHALFTPMRKRIAVALAMAAAVAGVCFLVLPPTDVSREISTARSASSGGGKTQPADRVSIQRVADAMAKLPPISAHRLLASRTAAERTDETALDVAAASPSPSPSHAPDSAQTAASAHPAAKRENADEQASPAMLGTAKRSLRRGKVQTYGGDYIAKNDERGIAFGVGYRASGAGGNANGSMPAFMSTGPSETTGGNDVTEMKKTTLTHAHHRMPIKVEASVRYRLNNRWSLQTGVTYSYLYSELSEQTGNSRRDAAQKLHYVGVPLTASYSLVRGKSIGVYASAGGEVERLVKGNANVTDYVGSQPAISRREIIHDSKLQLSAHAAVGVEYQPVSEVSLFAEPSVNYYFAGGSKVQSAYTDKRLHVEMNIGLRFNINKK